MSAPAHGGSYRYEGRPRNTRNNKISHPTNLDRKISHPKNLDRTRIVISHRGVHLGSTPRHLDDETTINYLKTTCAAVNTLMPRKAVHATDSVSGSFDHPTFRSQYRSFNRFCTRKNTCVTGDLIACKTLSCVSHR